MNHKSLHGTSKPRKKVRIPMANELLICVDIIIIERDSYHIFMSVFGYIQILLTKSRDVKWWMKDIEK